MCYDTAMNQEQIKEKIIEAVESTPHKDYIQSIAIFGSYLHGDARPDSDIDLLLELNKTIGLFTLADIQLNFEKKLGRRIDLVEKESLTKYLKPKILKEARKVYERK